MKKILNKVLPKEINNKYEGYKIALYVFLMYASISIIRSLIHVFSSDGGAGSIAKVDLTQGAENIIFVFALWGSSQLIVAIIQFIVAFRYKKLLPLMYLLLFLEYGLRTYIGNVRPMIFEVGAGAPPGAYLNKLMIPLTIIMFILTVIEPRKRNKG